MEPGIGQLDWRIIRSGLIKYSGLLTGFLCWENDIKKD
jgi:hypothetical protein